jgi:hypothetical protein
MKTEFRVIRMLNKLSRLAYKEYFAQRNDTSKYYNIIYLLNAVADLFNISWNTCDKPTKEKS